MRNKWYVLAIGGVAVIFAILTIRGLLRDTSPILLLPLAAIAIGLGYAAYKISQAASFAPDKGRGAGEYNVSTHVSRSQRNQPPNPPPAA